MAVPSARLRSVLATLGLVAAALAPVSAARAAATSFRPTADSYVNSETPTRNYGNTTALELRGGSPTKTAYLKFKVSNVTLPVASAKLRLQPIGADACGSDAGVQVFKAAGTAWTEGGLTWRNQPGSVGAMLSSQDGFAAGSPVTLDVTGAITRSSGAIAFVLRLPACGAALNRFSSRETVSKPELVISSVADDVAPSVVVGEPTEGGTITRRQVARGTASDNVAVSRVEISIDGHPWSVAACEGCTTQTALWERDISGLAPGPHSISVRASDRSGNESVATRSFEVVDAPPTVTITDPTENDMTLPRDFVIKGTATDDMVVDDVQVSFGAVEDWRPVTTCAGCPTRTTQWTYALGDLLPGAYTVSVRAADLAGNNSEIVTRSFFVADGDAPPPPSADCVGTHINHGDNLVSAIKGATNTTFCIHAGTYDLGSGSLEPGSGVKLIGDPVTVSESGAIEAPTKIVSRGRGGVIQFATDASGVLIENLDLSGATGDRSCKPQCGRGINGRGGNAKDVTVRYTRIHHNASLGIGGVQSLFVTHSELDNNGASAFNGCCAGALKVVDPFTIRQSYIHHNAGNGVWQDICGKDFVVARNTITWNAFSGVRYEHNQDCPG